MRIRFTKETKLYRQTYKRGTVADLSATDAQTVIGWDCGHQDGDPAPARAGHKGKEVRAFKGPSTKDLVEPI